MSTSPPPFGTRIRWRCEEAAFQTLGALSRLVPRRAAPRIGSVLGLAACALAGRRREIARANVKAALGGEIDPAEQARIVRGAWRHLGRLLVEGLMFPRYSPRDAGTLLHYSGLDHIRSAYASGRGVLLFSGHFGNWELVALMQGYLGMPLRMITRPLDNPILERRLARLRGMSGNDIVHKTNAMRPMLEAVRAGKGVAIVIDQNVRDGTGEFVEFLGRKAATTPSLGLVATRTAAAVIPVFAIPRPDGSYDVQYLPEVTVNRTGDRKEDALAMTRRCTAIIEQHVRRYPAAWLWMHERWKTRPLEEQRAARRAREAEERSRGSAPARGGP